MESKRKNVYITIFVITTIIASCIAVYFGISENTSKKEIKELEKKVEDIKNEIGKNQSSEKETETNKSQILLENSKIVPFNKLNIVSDKENLEIIRTSRGMKVSLNIKGEVTLNLVSPDIKSLYPNLDEKFISENHKISNLSDQVVDVQAIPLNAYSEDTVILFLLKNNTIEYITLSEICKDKDLNNIKKIDDINGVIKIDAVSYFTPYSEGKIVPVAITDDGNMYDLYDKIVK